MRSQASKHSLLGKVRHVERGDEMCILSMVAALYADKTTQRECALRVIKRIAQYISLCKAFIPLSKLCFSLFIVFTYVLTLLRTTGVILDYKARELCTELSILKVYFTDLF